MSDRSGEQRDAVRAEEPVEGAAPDPRPADLDDEPAVVARADRASPPLEPPVLGSRHLLGASFDLLARSNEEMRTASFYAGAIAFGTVAPLAMGALWIAGMTEPMATSDAEALLLGPVGLWLSMLAWPAVIGLIVIGIESRAMAAAILAARWIERPLTREQALARARMVFWRAIGAGLITGIPIALIQFGLEEGVDSILRAPGQATLPISLVVTAIVGGPLAYVTAGVVLGDVAPVEALRRSIRVFRARKIASVVVAMFEAVAAILILFGVDTGLDVATRVFGSLGIGTGSGPAGMVLVTVGVAAASFAFGTLIFTVSAIAIAPQVVMFVGLTRATMGLDHVRLGGSHDPLVVRPGSRRFRVFTRSMLVGIVVAWVGLVALAMQLLAV